MSVEWDVSGVPISVLNIVGVAIAWHHHPDEPAIQAALHDAVSRRLVEVAPSVWNRNEFVNTLALYDPELYGLPVCGQLSLEGGAPCDLAEGHELHFRVAHRHARVVPVPSDETGVSDG